MANLSKADKAAELSATQVRLRKETVLLELRQMELAKVRGEMIPAAEVSRAWEGIGAKLQAAVLSLPSKCAEAAAAAKTARDVEALLRAECESILKGLADDLAATTTRV